MRAVLVEGICKCNRYTVLKNTGIYDPRTIRGFIKVPVCTGCSRREEFCDCRYHEGKTMFGNLDQQKRLREIFKGEPVFRITGTGNGAVNGKPF